MEYNNAVPDIWGTGVILSALTLEEVAAIVSEKLFGGLPFGGKDRFIYEEVPAIFIGSPILGLQMILAEGKFGSYVLNVQPYGTYASYLYKNEVPRVSISLDAYLYHLLKQGLKDVSGVKVVHAQSE